MWIPIRAHAAGTFTVLNATALILHEVGHVFFTPLG